MGVVSVEMVQLIRRMTCHTDTSEQNTEKVLSLAGENERLIRLFYPSCWPL
jgi:hypothetical protein